MTYALSIGPWHVGPFLTAYAAQHWAERHGVDTWQLVEMDDPAEAPTRPALMRDVPQPLLAVTPKSPL